MTIIKQLTNLIRTAPYIGKIINTYQLCNNDKSLEENIYSLEAIADLEYQYQFEKMVSTKKC